MASAAASDDDDDGSGNDDDGMLMTMMAADDDDSDDDDGDDGDAMDERDDDIDIGFRNHGGRRRRPRTGPGGRNVGKEEAIYGVFWEDDDGGGNDGRRGDRRGAGRGGGASRPSGGLAAAPMFVAAKRPEASAAGTPSRAKAATPVASSQPGQVATEDVDGTNNGTRPAPAVAPTGKGGGDADGDEQHDEEAARLRQEQKEADDYFLRLLAKARQKATKASSAKGRTSRPARPPGSADAGGSNSRPHEAAGPPNVGPDHFDGPPQIGLGMGMPSSFGGRPHERVLPSSSSSPTDPVRLDPSMGRWEKHTKGVGSRLLSKMGWSGRGGLGSVRRQRRAAPPEEETGDARGEAAAEGGAGTGQPGDIPNRAWNDEHGPPAGGGAPPTAVKRGISRPVEVVVRPNNLGLGFGNFKEATQLKSNRLIEAEVRGLDPAEAAGNQNDRSKRKRRGDFDDDDDEAGEGAIGGMSATTSSAIPSTQEILSQQSWKRRRRQQEGKGQKRNRPEIISYQELIERQKQKSAGSGTGQQVIIDMRGPDFAQGMAAGATPGTAKGDKIGLGDELLYNLSFLLNTYENRLHSASNFVQSTRRKAESIKSDILDLEQRHQKGEERLGKLRKAFQTVESVQDITANARMKATGSLEESMQTSLRQVQVLVSELGKSFSEEDRETLQFWTVLAPTMLSPVVQATMDAWDPLHEEGLKAASKNLIDAFFDFKSGLANGVMGGVEADGQELHERGALMESLIRNLLVPKIKSALDSSRWDPIKDGDVALDVCEYVLGKAAGFEKSSRRPSPEHATYDADDKNQVLPSEREDQTERTGELSLADGIKADLILDTVYPKLQAAISQWKPALSKGAHSFQLEDRLDLWVLPWIPHLDHPVLLPNLLADCKRKLKGSLSFLQRTIVADQDFITAIVELVRPWQGVYDVKTLRRMMTDDASVIPRLARLLSKQSIARDATEQVWGGMYLLMKMHGHNLISDRDFLSIVEADVLSNWADRVHATLSQGGRDNVPSKEGHNVIERAALDYREWKLHILVDPSPMGTPLPDRRSVLLLQSDVFICRIFYSVLRMIQLSTLSKTDELNVLRPEKTSYHIVAARRLRENQTEVEEAFTRMESRSVGEATARIRLQRRNIPEPTFRDVVEELAKDRGILFQPRMGANARKDGKQVFLFGKLPIYLEGDVVFCWRDSAWIPLSVDELMRAASAA